MTLRMAKAKLRLHVRKRRQNPEQILHKAVADYLRVALIPPAFFTTFPSGGGGKTRGAILKGLGLMPGMPDLLVFWNHQTYRGLLAGIELKEKGRVSPEQIACHKAFARINVPIAICRSIDDVGNALSFWGVPHRARPA